MRGSSCLNYRLFHNIWRSENKESAEKQQTSSEPQWYKWNAERRWPSTPNINRLKPRSQAKWRGKWKRKGNCALNNNQNADGENSFFLSCDTVTVDSETHYLRLGRVIRWWGSKRLTGVQTRMFTTQRSFVLLASFCVIRWSQGRI